MYQIELQNEAGYPLNEERLQQAISAVLQQQRAPTTSALTVVFVDDDTIAEYNQRYRGVAAATDVLSFPAAPPPLPLDDSSYLGDLIIAYPYARAQAARLGHDLDDSLALLVIHGTLHLLGFKHDTPAAKSAMWAAQSRALAALGISAAIVPELEEDGGRE